MHELNQLLHLGRLVLQHQVRALHAAQVLEQVHERRDAHTCGRDAPLTDRSQPLLSSLPQFAADLVVGRRKQVSSRLEVVGRLDRELQRVPRAGSRGIAFHRPQRSVGGLKQHRPTTLLLGDASSDTIVPAHYRRRARGHVVELEVVHQLQLAHRPVGLRLVLQVSVAEDLDPEGQTIHGLLPQSCLKPLLAGHHAMLTPLRKTFAHHLPGRIRRALGELAQNNLTGGNS